MHSMHAALLQSLNTIDGGTPWGLVAELQITGAPVPFRVTSDNVPTVFHGITYQPWPMRTQGVESTAEDVVQRVQMTVSNVDGQIVALCEQYWATAVEPDWTVYLWRVDFSNPDLVPLTFRETFTVDSITTTWIAATFDMSASGRTLSRQSPARRFNAASGFDLLPRF